MALVLAATLANAQTAPAPPGAVKPEAVREAERALWSPGEALYLRRWMVKGLAAPPADEAKLLATPDWKPLVAWDDLTDLTAAGAEGRWLYASALVRRDAEGPAELSLGAGGPLSAWVNGEPVALPTQPTGLRDAVRVPVRLRAGDNVLLLRAERDSGATLLSARILSPGQPLADVRLEPGAWDQDGQLQVRTDSLPRQGTVEVVITAPGGRVVGRVSAPRGSIAALPTEGWPDGPYEVAVRATNAAGEPLLAFAPWFKGDMAPAARALLDQAAGATGADAESGHWRMLGALVADRAGADLSRLKSAYAPVHSALMEAAEMRMGPKAAIRASGFVRLAWIDPLDGSTQFCRAYLPAGYDQGRAWPAVLYLHGANGAAPPYVRYWNVDVRHGGVAERWPMIWIEPHGRGTNGYLGPGELDVINCLEAARARLNVDDTRTYLTGGSMGGKGTWQLGARHAGRFAALAPVFGGADPRLDSKSGRDDPAADRPMERWLREAESDFAGLEALNNTPVFIHQGDEDVAADVRQARHATTLLQRWGYDVRYREYPGRGHEALGELDDIVGWFLQHRQAEAPTKVRLRAADLRAARAHWLTVDRAMAPLSMIQVDAEMTEPGVLRLDTRNVARLNLAPPPSLLRRDAALKVVWNGRPLEIAPGSDGRFVLAAPDAPRGATFKTPALPGGVLDILSTPFVIVVGTTAHDPDMRASIRDKAQVLAGLWRSVYGGEPRIVDDRALTAEQAKSLSLILLGGPDANAVSARLRRDLPLAVAADSITIDGRRFEAKDAYAVMLRPSPRAADRYVLSVAATSAAGLFAWEPFSLVAVMGDSIANPYDWWVGDGRRPAQPRGRAPDRGWIASGVFDQAWRRDDRWTFLGDPALRAATPLLARPKATVILPSTVLDRYVGRYALADRPGVTLVVRRDGDVLMVDPPAGLPRDKLLAESPTRFRFASDGSLAEAVLDPAGKVVELRFGEGGGASTWRPAPQ
ncbi:prolyl oligopeptidase family serine peptidase [Caulobacter segnis]|uniref:prolyl oligopeptidase family serine peptidase n=1 Tax=Caulobacter segnis TaxID=88688 RepID=UPI001CBF0A4D|nr:prolyl oligopeptidase family serine peptidase [Caulobacter segnis]UAL09394.1 prolyl oligopeptidase family serine peptidase [Caulobacter segnis]